MTFTIAITFVYAVIMVLAGVIGLLVLNIAFVRVFFRQSPGTNPARYWPFVREHVSRRRLSLTLLRIPFLLTALFMAVVIILCLTDTHRVRSNILQSTSLVVRTGGNCHRNPERERTLLKTKDTRTIKELAEQISLNFSVFGMNCMCCGDMTFDLYQGHELHYSFSLHHGQSIRNNRFTLGDKELSSLSQEKLKDWLDQTGVTKSLTEIREQQEKKCRCSLWKRNHFKSLLNLRFRQILNSRAMHLFRPDDPGHLFVGIYYEKKYFIIHYNKFDIWAIILDICRS